jgi:hypothetical protein
MTFFYDLNKKLDSIREKPELTHGQLNERDMGKHNNATTGFKALAKKAGGGEKGERIAGAQFQKMKKAGQLEEAGNDLKSYSTSALKAASSKDSKADKKSGVDPQYSTQQIKDELKRRTQEVDEGMGDMAKKVGGMAKKVGGAVLNKVGHGSDADMIRDLQRKMGVPQTGMKPGAEPNPKQVKEKMNPAKAKSFAALAEPKDKITFADKIAGAKKEVDEMLGDVAAEAMKSALSGGQKKLDKNNNGKLDANDFAMLRKGGKQKTTEEDDDNPFTSWKKPRKDTPRVGDVTRGHKHDIKHTATGQIVTRRTDPNTGHSVGSDDDTPADSEKRSRGRPKGTGKSMGAKGPSGKSKLMTKEAEYDSEEIKKAMAMLKKAGYKVSKAVEEESTTTRDNRAEKAGKRVAKDIEYDEKKKDGIHGKKRGAEDDKAERAGKKVAKDIEYDEKKGRKEVEETTVSGSIAPSAAAPAGKSKSGMSFGKGIYDSMNRDLEQMIAESMNISMNMNSDGQGGPTKSLTVTATDEDAVYLGKLLKMAGMGGEQGGCGCGSEPCSCGSNAEVVDENQPDWPTDTETSSDAMQYSGGLNKPKSTGQTTVPVIASQEERQYADDEEDAIKRMMEMAGIKTEAKKPDFLDMDKDGNKEEPMAKAVKDKEKKVEESIFALTNQWKVYKG